MKISYFIFLSLFIALSSCEQKTGETVTATSEDGKVSVTINASQAVRLDPWTVNIAIVTETDSASYSFGEFYIDDFTAETVRFDWKNNNACTIVFYERSGQQKVFELYADNRQIKLVPVSGFGI